MLLITTAIAQVITAAQHKVQSRYETKSAAQSLLDELVEVLAHRPYHTNISLFQRRTSFISAISLLPSVCDRVYLTLVFHVCRLCLIASSQETEARIRERQLGIALTARVMQRAVAVAEW